MKIKEWLLNQTTAKVVDLFITEYLKIDTEVYDKDFDAIDSEDYIQFSLEEWLDSEKNVIFAKVNMQQKSALQELLIVINAGKRQQRSVKRMIKIDVEKDDIAIMDGSTPTLLAEITTVIVALAKMKKVSPLKLVDEIKKAIETNPQIIQYLIKEYL